jgi:hypothetical protein
MSPSFSARFSDGVETRMTVWLAEGRATFDLKRRRDDESP